MQFKSRDGLDISGIAVQLRRRRIGVPFSGAKPPAVLWIHGGPEGRNILSFRSLGPLFDAQQGYVVLEAELPV